MTGNIWLALAILFEVIATSFLKVSDGFSKLLPSALAVLGYGLAFFCLSHALRTIEVGIAYAIWCGAGIVLIAAIGWIIFGQRLDAWSLTAIGLILAGTIMLNFHGAPG